MQRLDRGFGYYKVKGELQDEPGDRKVSAGEANGNIAGVEEKVVREVNGDLSVNDGDWEEIHTRDIPSDVLADSQISSKAAKKTWWPWSKRA